MIDIPKCPICGAPMENNICQECQTMYIRRDKMKFDLIIKMPYKMEKDYLPIKYKELKRQLKYANVWIVYTE